MPRQVPIFAVLLVVCGLLLLACPEELPVPPVEPVADPGTVTIHRLNRAEYDNTVRDLLLTDLRPGEDFPSDDFGDGFDNMADTLSLSPLHIEMYELAADALLDDSWFPGLQESMLWNFEAEGDEVTATAGAAYGDNWNLWSNAELSALVTIPETGRYLFSARVWQDAAGDNNARASLRVDQVDIEYFEIAATSAAPVIIEVEVEVGQGGHSFSIAFLNDYYVPDVADRNLRIDWLRVEGPLDLEIEPSAGRQLLLVCEPGESAETQQACASEVLATFAPRAWRRPLAEGELERLLSLYQFSIDSGGSWDEAVGLGLKAALLSPHFVYRVELDSDPGDPTAHRLNAYELASRLSYFLWSSMPDDALFAAAADGSLLEDEVLEVQVRRMLAAERAAALVDNLGGQWLYLRAIDDSIPDYPTFNSWSEELRDSMREQLRLFLSDTLLDDRSMLELLTGTETWVDPLLATHYGLPELSGEDWELVSLEGTGRRGILGTGALLTALSYPTRTSPVLRGKWVLANLTCELPAPPPAGVEGLDVELGEGLSLRQRMELHRSDPTCSSCHSLMDPVGFALERFDGVGAARDVDEYGLPIDDAVELPGGASFEGLEGLSASLAADRKVPWCMTQKVFTYALGRPPVIEDLRYLDGIDAAFAASSYRFADLALGIALSEPFRSRRGRPDSGSADGGEGDSR
jgi:hypothetical protein